MADGMTMYALPPGTVRLEGFLSKRPTWTLGSSAGRASEFRLRYFVLRDVLEYYASQESYLKGGVPRGTMDIVGAVINRESKLEFTISTAKKRLYLRAMSEQLALQWLAVFLGMGAIPAPSE